MFLLLFFVFQLSINEPVNLDQKLPIEEVEVSGFLYKYQLGTYILSSEPNLKSCCVGVNAKASSQIFCQFEEEEIEATGLIKVFGRLEKEGERLILKNCSIKKNKTFPIKSLSIAFLGIVLLFYVRKRSAKKYSNRMKG